MSELLLENLGAAGTVIIDGPLARNRLFGRILQTLRPGDKVCVSNAAHGAAAAALFLVSGSAPSPPGEACIPLTHDSIALTRHRDEWRRRTADLRVN